jgi:hypothetical protein
VVILCILAAQNNNCVRVSVNVHHHHTKGRQEGRMEKIKIVFVRTNDFSGASQFTTLTDGPINEPTTTNNCTRLLSLFSFKKKIIIHMQKRIYRFFS